MHVTGKVTQFPAMKRKLDASLRAVYTLLSILLLALACPVQAVTPGDLVVQSSPGKPLRAIIPLIMQEDESLAELHVLLASQADYTMQKLERSESLEDMQIALLSTGENRGRIQLFGKHPWNGDEVIVLLQLRWPTGQMNRRFRIAPVEVETDAEKPPLYVEVGQNESLDTIAIRLSKHSNRSYLHMMVALYRANPDAFYRDNINNLKSGVRLRVPDNEELYRLSDAEVNETLREHKARWLAENEEASREREDKQKLEQQLQLVKQDNAEIEQRNQELKQRLARLEKQINSMSQQVLEYPAAEQEAATGPARSQNAPKPGEDKTENADKPAASDEGGLSGMSMVLLMLLVALVVIAIWHFAPRRGKGQV